MKFSKIKQNAFRIIWEKEAIIADFNKIRESHGNLISEVRIYSTKETKVGFDLAMCNLNLLSGISKSKLAKELTAKVDTLKWQECIEKACILVVDTFREGDPVETISSQDEVEEIQYKLAPFIFKNQPTVFFGKGGSGKGYLVLFFAICISLNWQDNPLNLKPEKGNVLYLDWESDRDSNRRRLKNIYHGPVSISYRRCSASFVDDLENIQQIIFTNNIDTIIIDSLGVACGGDPNSSEIANRFFLALRSLPVTSILIAHTSKAESDRKTIFGSVYWLNLSRAVWEVRKAEDSEDDELLMGLRHAKSNESQLQRPMAVKLHFNGSGVSFSREKYIDVPEFSNLLSIKPRLLYFLKKGMKTTKEISDELGLAYNSVRITATRLEKEGKIIKIDKGLWGLKQE